MPPFKGKKLKTNPEAERNFYHEGVAWRSHRGQARVGDVCDAIVVVNHDVIQETVRKTRLILRQVIHLQQVARNGVIDGELDGTRLRISALNLALRDL